MSPWEDRRKEPPSWESLYSSWRSREGERVALRVLKQDMPEEQWGPTEVATFRYIVKQPGDGFLERRRGLDDTAIFLARAADDPEETAATWIAAWCFEQLGRRCEKWGWVGEPHYLIEAVQSVPRVRSADRWHHAVTQTLPVSFVGFSGDDGRPVPPEDYWDVVQAVVVAAAMTAGLYEVVYQKSPSLTRLEEREREERGRSK